MIIKYNKLNDTDKKIIKCNYENKANKIESILCGYNISISTLYKVLAEFNVPRRRYVGRIGKQLKEKFESVKVNNVKDKYQTENPLAFKIEVGKTYNSIYHREVYIKELLINTYLIHYPFPYVGTSITSIETIYYDEFGSSYCGDKLSLLDTIDKPEPVIDNTLDLSSLSEKDKKVVIQLINLLKDSN